MRDAQQIYDEFWRPILYPEGEFDLEQMKKELADYYLAISSMKIVYHHITKGAVINHTFPVGQILELHDKLWVERADRDTKEDRGILREDEGHDQDVAQVTRVPHEQAPERELGDNNGPDRPMDTSEDG